MAVKGLDELRNALLKAVDDATSPGEMKRYGEFAADRIRKRTRLGYGVKQTGGQREKLKELSPGYVEQRRSNKALSSNTSAKKSNLTKTGQMLDSLKVITANRGEAIVGPSGSRNDSDSTNAEISGYVQEQGRPYLNLTDIEIKAVTTLVEKTIRDYLKKLT